MKWLVSLLLISGCVHVEPWQRGVLADVRMKADPSAGRAAARRHVLSTREGTEGASRAAGAAIRGGSLSIFSAAAMSRGAVLPQ